MNELIGRQIDHYRIDTLLGEGGMGAVYRAYDLNLARPVAFKVMHGNLASQDEFKARFMQEAQSAAKLNHPSIVTVHYFGASQGLLFMVMSYIPGGSLSTHMREIQQRGEAVQLREVLLFMAQVADALGYAHRQGVVHRDIKPSNVLMQRLETSDSDGGIPLRAVVTDFGLAKLLSGGVETKSDTLLGTYPYMSPEQCLQQPIDGRSDLYSLGVMLYQLTTGKMPLDIHSATDAVLKHHLNEKPVPPRQAWPALPAAVENIIVKAIAHDPADRYQNGEAVAADLREAARSLPDEDITQFESQRNVKSLVTRLEAEEPAEPSNMGSDLPFPGTSDRFIIAQKDHTPRSMAITKKQVNIGRTNENEIVLDHSDVSRRHAFLEQTSTGWQITDLGSTNGTFIEGNKLLPNIPEPLQPGKTFRIGPFSIYWKRAESRPVGKSQAGSMRSPSLGMTGIQSSSGQIGASIQPTRLEIAPGTHEQMQLELFNGGDLVDHFKLSVKNFPSEWVTISDPVAELMPGANTTVMIDIHPPMDSTARAGSHQLQLLISSVSKPSETVTIPGDVVVKPFERFAVQIQPSQIPQGGKAHITINNQGNADGTYSIAGRDPANAIQFVGEQGRVRVPPGQTSTQALQVKAKSRPFFGTMQTLPFEVQVKSAKIEQPQVMPGQLRVAPYLPIWVLSLLVILITLCLAISSLAYSQVIVPSNNTKSAATAAFNQGATLSAQNAAQNAQSTAGASTAMAQTADAVGDADHDGLSNQKEAQLQTDPQKKDTDGDGLLDGEEVNIYGTDPRNHDSDSDGLLDGEEVKLGTQPMKADTDGDGVSDGLDPQPLATPMPTAMPPTPKPPPTATAIVNAFNGEWRATVTIQPVHVSFAIAQLIVSNLNPQGNLATIHVCRCNSANCDARVEVSPPQANAGVDGLKLVTTEPFYISESRFWILRTVRSDKQLSVSVEEYDSQTKQLIGLPDNFTLRRPTNKEKNTNFPCSTSVFTPLTTIILNPSLFLLPVTPTPVQ